MNCARELRLTALVLFGVCLAPSGAVGGEPDWARQPDRADAAGHTFVCQGDGASEEEATTAAAAICNDKICRVCGVEVESTLKAVETLKGVEVRRVVTERCRRVRKGDSKPRYKSTDCGPKGCRVWLQILYTKADEEAECPRYAAEKFDDPQACEAAVEGFGTIIGRSAKAFKRRLDLLDQALAACAKIDVRPTPALTAMHTWLVRGLDSFEYTAAEQQKHSEGLRRGYAYEWRGLDRPLWGRFLDVDPALHDRLEVEKTFIGKLELIRGLVDDKYRIFSIFDGLERPDLDSPTGLARLLAAMQALPVGQRYNVKYNIHMHAIQMLVSKKIAADTAAISDYMRRAYPPDEVLKIDTGVFAHDEYMARFFAYDGKATPEEWDYLVEANGHLPCPTCLRSLIDAPDHGGDEIRLQRIHAAYAAYPKIRSAGHRSYRRYTVDADGHPQDPTYLPLRDPRFVLDIEAELPPHMQRWYDDALLSELYASAKRLGDAALQARVAARYVTALAARPPADRVHHVCTHLQSRLEELVADGVGGLEAVHDQVCWCIAGRLKELKTDQRLRTFWKERGRRCK